MPVATEVLEGLACAGCGVKFARKHEFPVFCRKCYKTAPLEQRAVTALALYQEV